MDGHTGDGELGDNTAARPARPVSGPASYPGAQPGALREGVRGDGGRTETAAQGGASPERRDSRLQRGLPTPLSSGRGRSSAVAASSLLHRLTGRDRAVLTALRRFGVFTTEQIAEMFFDSPGRARVRLVELHRLGLLERFRPYRESWGSAPFHYVLSRTGAGMAAAQAGEDPVAAERRWTPSGSLALSGSQRLGHITDVSGFHAALVGRARRDPQARLIRWRTEPEVASWLSPSGSGWWSSAPGVVRPDGWGRWRDGGFQVEFFLEWDRGTETLSRLVAKLGGYEILEGERGVAAWVLFAFGSTRREHNARAALEGATVAIATAVLGSPPEPWSGVWLPVDDADLPRLPLAALGGVTLPPEALERAARARKPWLYEDNDTAGAP